MGVGLDLATVPFQHSGIPSTAEASSPVFSVTHLFDEAKVPLCHVLYQYNL